MAEVYYVHPENPQQRLLEKVAKRIDDGALVVYPNDCSYSLACHMGDKEALARLRQLRGLSDKHFLTLICRDLSELGYYARVENSAFRLLKRLTPGPYTFLLKASREVPKRLLHPKRRTLGLRVPDNMVTQALLAAIDEPLLTTSLLLAGEKQSLEDPYEIFLKFDKLVDVIIDCGPCASARTTVIDLQEGEPELVRQGKGVWP